MRKISIIVSGFSFQAELNESDTANAIWGALPLKATVNVWGDEIYFQVHEQVHLEKDAKAEVNIGDLCYWPTLPAFCIFFGPTPLSTSAQPVAADKVNVFGRIIDLEPENLRKVKDGDAILIEKIKL